MPLELNEGRLDAKKIEDGVWWSLRLEQGPDGVYFDGDPLPCQPPTEQPAVLIRYVGDGIEFDRALDDARRPYRAEMREKDGRLSPENERKTVAEATARVLWRGCQGLTIGGQLWKWSEPEAAKLLALREWWKLSDFISRKARVRSVLEIHEEAKASGN